MNDFSDDNKMDRWMDGRLAVIWRSSCPLALRLSGSPTASQSSSPHLPSSPSLPFSLRSLLPAAEFHPGIPSLVAGYFFSQERFLETIPLNPSATHANQFAVTICP